MAEHDSTTRLFRAHDYLIQDEEKRKTKKLKQIPAYLAGFDPTYSDGGSFERAIVSSFLDKREEALRDWGIGNRIVDTSPPQIEKVNQAVAHLRRERRDA